MQSPSEINDPLSRPNFPRLVVSARSEFHEDSGMYAEATEPTFSSRITFSGKVRERDVVFYGDRVISTAVK